MSKGTSDGEFTEAPREHQPATTTEVGETVGIVRQSAGYRLQKIGKRGDCDVEESWTSSDMDAGRGVGISDGL